jgi:excisionase family DNA binding protein
MSASERNLLTRDEVCEFFGMKKSKFYNMRKANMIPFVVVGGSKRYPKDQIQAKYGCNLL